MKHETLRQHNNSNSHNNIRIVGSGVFCAFRPCAVWLCNIAAARKDAFCWVRPKAISGEQKQNSQESKGEAYSETNPSSRRRRCYVRTMTARVQLRKKCNVWSWASRGLASRWTDCLWTANHEVTLTLTLRVERPESPVSSRETEPSEVVQGRR
jgi:hypothetical protein